MISSRFCARTLSCAPWKACSHAISGKAGVHATRSNSSGREYSPWFCTAATRSATSILLLRYVRQFSTQLQADQTVRAPRPKAKRDVGTNDVDRRRWTAAVAASVLGLAGVAAGLALVAKQENMTATELLSYASEQLLHMGDMEPADIAACLPDIDHYSDPETGHKGRPSRGGVRRRPLGTIIVGWEGSLVDVVYNAKAGRIVVPRPGFERLLLACADADIEVVIWSATQSTPVVEEQLAYLLQHLVIPRDQARYTEFVTFLVEGYETAKAVELGMATKEGRPVRPMMPLIESEKPRLYQESVLRIVSVLGREHTLSGSRPLHLLTARRPPSDLVILDSDTTLKDVDGIGAQTLLLPPFKAPDKPLQSPSDADPTLMLVASMIDRFDAWRTARKKQQGEAAAAGTGGGDVGLATFVDSLCSRAAAGGLRPSTGKPIDDTVGILGQVIADASSEAPSVEGGRAKK